MNDFIRLGYAALPAELMSLIAPPLVGGNIKVLEDANYIYVKSAYDVAGDYEQIRRVIKYANKSDSHSLVKIEAAASGIATDFATAGKIVRSSSDDNPPFRVNNSYVGGNHGWGMLLKVTKEDHGLAFSDIGTKWVDNTAKEWWLIYIASSSVVYFVSPFIGDENSWTFISTMGTTLTKDGTATTLTGYTSIGQQQLNGLADSTVNESMRNKTRSAYKDGTTLIETGVETECRFLVIEESYDIINLYNEVEYIKAHAGSFSANPTFNYADPAFSVTLKYVFQDFGAYLIYQSIQSHITAALTANSDNDSLRGGQMGVMKYATTYAGAGCKLKLYMPGVDATASAQVNNKLTELAVSPATPAMTAKAIASSDRVSGLELPSRLLSIMTSSEDAPVYVSAIGYSPYVLNSSLANRALNCGRLWYFSTSVKAYPHYFSPAANTTLPRGLYESLVYDIIRACDIGNATSVYWWNERDYAYVYIDYHSTQRETLVLPEAFKNLTYRVVSKTAGFGIGSAGYIGEDCEIEVDVTVTSGVGEWALLKVKDI